MENLTSDIVLEILSRIPKTDIKSVLQCRKVCKLWRTLLGKPKTGMLFTQKPKYCDRGPVDLYYREKSCEMVNLNSTELEQNFENIVIKIGSIGTGIWNFGMVGTCNGLVCYETLAVIYIFNPMTGECICLSSDKKRKRTSPPKIGACFECSGFGYCHSIDAYKVVKIFYMKDAKRRVQVYTLGEGSGWRDIPEITSNTYTFQGFGVFANGALHWLNKKPNLNILAFDLADETFRSLPSPPCHILSNSYMDVNLGSFGGNLYLCLRYMKQGEPMVDIWIFKNKNMNNCRHSTRLKERTYLNSFAWFKLFSRKWDSLSKCELLSLTKSEILLWQNGVLSCYDLKTSKKIWYAKGAKEFVYQATPHLHSLVSLKDLGEKLVCRSERHPRMVATR